MVFGSLLRSFGKAKAPQCILRSSFSNCEQQESKVLVLGSRVTTGNPLNQPEGLSTITEAHWLLLKWATFRLKLLDKEGRYKSRFEIDQFSIVPNLLEVVVKKV
jgi:hypothetical protein